MTEELALLPGRLTSHLQLTVVALVLGTLVSVPLGILATRKTWVERVVLGVAGVVQTIPALALLAAMVPALGALSLLATRLFGAGFRSIGTLPALVALVLYSTLPILRNTWAGIRGVDPAIQEAALGTGMTARQRLVLVELPLAMPVIVAGLRTSTVWVVGMATLSTPVGATSLGNYIFTGLQTRNHAAVLVGCVAAAVLALVLDGLIRRLESRVRTGRRPVGSLVVLGLVLLYTAGSFAWPALAGAPVREIRIGGKPFTEQYVLGEILAGRVRERTGSPTWAIESLGSTVAFDALHAGDLDAYVDYTGTIWTTVMKRSDVPPRGQVLEEVTRHLERRFGIGVVASLGFENAYCLAMRSADARAAGIRKLSQLGPRAPGLSIGADYELFGRGEWRALVRTYGLAFREQRTMDPSLLYEAVASREVDVIGAYTTDGRIRAFDLTVLKDDAGAIPPYDAVILVSPRLRRERPEVVAALGSLNGRISADRMREMNQGVDAEHRRPAEVARAFLRGERRRSGP